MQNMKLQALFITVDETLENAMKRLDETAEKNLYVVNEKRQLMGSISDGDIRRGILKGLGLNTSVSSVMNSEPKYVRDTELNFQQKSKDVMLNYEIESLPVVNVDGSVVNVIYWADVFKEKKRVYPKKSNPVFILAGGTGSRLEPFTKVLPKPLVPVGELPILERIMDKFSAFGFDDFILSVNYKAEMIKLYLSTAEVAEKYKSLTYIKEAQPLGTIGSLYLAKEHLNDSYFITNSDILVEDDYDRIMDFHKNQGSILTIVGCLKNSLIPYGVLNVDDSGHLVSIEEKPEYKHVINTGVYAAEPKLIQYIKPDEKMNINELIDILLAEGEKISIYPILEGQWFDIGQWHEFERTRKYFE